MRELKFRAWDKEEKKYLLPKKQEFIIVPTSPSFGVTLPYHRGRNFSGDEDCFDWADADLLMGRYELEQYTGLKDKNGKEIYEGDIVKIYRGRKLDSVLLVQFDEPNGEYAWCKYEDIDSARYGGFPYWAKYLVIGNIHENKELLGGEE